MRQKTKKNVKHAPYLKLKAALAERGLRQRHLAELLNMSPATLNQKINGTLEFTYSEAEKIADFLQAKTDDIFFTQKVTRV